MRTGDFCSDLLDGRRWMLGNLSSGQNAILITRSYFRNVLLRSTPSLRVGEGLQPELAKNCTSQATPSANESTSR